MARSVHSPFVICAALLGAGAFAISAGAARADDRLCPVPDAPGMSVQVPVYETFELAADVLAGRAVLAGRTALESVEVGPFFSSDGRALVSGGAQRTADVPAGPAPLDVLWCRGANDPRCGGGEPAPDGIRDFDATHAGAAVVEDRHALGRPKLSPAAPATGENGPRDGVRSELERPPRR